MIFLIGINHEKLFADTSYINTFKDDINHLIDRERIKIIAEENSGEAVSIHGKTPAQRLSEELNLNYIFANPDRNERKELGIGLRGDTARNLGINMTYGLSTEDENKINIAHRDADALREEEWFKRISTYTDQQMVFICGFNHLATFGDLLQHKGFDYAIYKSYE